MHPHGADRLLQAGLGFRAAKALLCAVELGVFTELARGPRTAKQLRRALGLNERTVPDLLDALVAMGMLDREGDDAQAVYLNTRETGHRLDRRSVAYVGHALEAAAVRNYDLWGGLAAVLRGATPLRTGDAADAAPAAPFAHVFDTFAEQLDASRWRSLAVLDTGGDQLTTALMRYHPQLRCARVASGTSLPACDAIVLVGMLGAASPEAKVGLIAQAWSALPHGGCLFAIDALIDDERRANLFALLASLNAAMEFGNGGGFSGADFERWCLGAGFAGTDVMPLDATCSAAVARK